MKLPCESFLPKRIKQYVVFACALQVLLLPKFGFGSTSALPETTQGVDSLIQTTWSQKYSNPAGFKAQSLMILKASNRLNYVHGIAYGNTYVGVFYYLNDRYDSAHYYFDSALRYFEEDDDQEGVARTYNFKGLCFDAMDDYDKALEAYTKSLNLKKKLGNEESIANTLNNIGSLYISGKQYDKALEFLEKAQTIYVHIENNGGKAMVLNNIGLVYDEMGDFDKAIEYYLGSLKLEESSGTAPGGLALSYNNIGSLYADYNRYDEATFYYKRALELYDEANSLSGMALVRNNLSEAYRNLNSPDASIQQAMLALNLADSINATEDLQLAHENLARTYKSMSKYEKALIHYEHSSILRDSLSKMRHRAEVADMQLNDVMAENYKTLQNEQFRIVRYGRDKTIQQILLIIGVLSILIVFGVHGNWISIDLKIVEVLLIVGVMCLFEGVVLLYNESFPGTGELDAIYRYGGHLVLFAISVVFILYARKIAKSEA